MGSYSFVSLQSSILTRTPCHGWLCLVQKTAIFPVGRPESVNLTSYGQPNIITCRPLSSPAAWSRHAQKNQCRISAATQFNRKGTLFFILGHLLYIKVMCRARSQLRTSLLDICIFPWPYYLASYAWSISNLMATVTKTFPVLGNKKIYPLQVRAVGTLREKG
jgi:hypothetical protein